MANTFLAGGGGFAASVVVLASEKASGLFVLLLGEKPLAEGPTQLKTGVKNVGEGLEAEIILCGNAECQRPFPQSLGETKKTQKGQKRQESWTPEPTPNKSPTQAKRRIRDGDLG